MRLVIAWRIMLMTLLGREVPELPAQLLFSASNSRCSPPALTRKRPPPTTIGEAGLHGAQRRSVGPLHRAVSKTPLGCLQFPPRLPRLAPQGLVEDGVGTLVLTRGPCVGIRALQSPRLQAQLSVSAGEPRSSASNGKLGTQN